MAEEFTAAHFVEFCKKFVGRPYWYGTCVYTCTESRYTSKAKQYPSHYTASRAKKYKQHIAAKEVCADCVGMIKGYCWTNGGDGVFEAIGTGKKFTSKYGANDCPDKSADGMFKYAKSKGMEHGTIDTIPEIPGIAVCYAGHVGVYEGDGKVIEERGFNYGCVETELERRPWKNWYKLPFINYGEKPEDVKPEDDAKPEDAIKPEDAAKPEDNKRPEGIDTSEAAKKKRTLHKGDDGDAVREMQQRLIIAGCELPKYGVDGDFGSETRAAVKAFQQAHGLVVDGVCGVKTWTELLKYVIADG